ncbi:cysteine hydrolase family protein [Anaeroglobus geminatus]|uniref:Isochorismatase-like domain-containing protein n=1 Tax=Anaeroglobus geminatus F0357 TaxID=861450 RepID=G9YJX0_9FIRM|nr:isochorismatase family protein [Anaeroglobus geminatus]EHM37980.1 hypothetical protein HMPREF0080_01976 [Anaeroglobus geminatus F0357]
MREVYVIIDMQNDFITGPLGTAQAREIPKRIEAKIQVLRRAEKRDTDLIFTQDTHDPDYLKTQEGKKLPVPHCLKDSRGWNICPTLLPYTMTADIYEKPSFGCPDLVAAVKDYEVITLMGLCTDICVITNAFLLKSWYPEKNIVVGAAPVVPA